MTVEPEVFEPTSHGFGDRRVTRYTKAPNFWSAGLAGPALPKPHLVTRMGRHPLRSWVWNKKASPTFRRAWSCARDTLSLFRGTAAIRTLGQAPCAPPATILQVVTALRDRGLTTPIGPDVLLRAGINESLVPRTLRSLAGLELIDEEGRLTPAMDALRRAPSADFKARLEEHIRAVYEEVFQFTDPAKDDAKRVADAFRAYEPIGQRSRMVTLFLGLCEAAGMIPEGVQRKPSAPALSGLPRKAAISRRPTERSKGDHQSGSSAATLAASTPAPLSGLLSSLPAASTGWTQSDRDRWVKLFGDVLDYVIPIREVSAQPDTDDLDDSD
jgi:hypothetical protein